jgi:arylsulfatase A-like enzyme
MNTRLLFVLAALPLVVRAAPKIPAEARNRPNILFVLVDDQRFDSLGCAGHPHLKTPVIDKLAAQGVRFEKTFVSTAICMASRACLFTGMTERSHGYTGGPSTRIIPGDVDTSFPTLLRQAGYRTGFFGKQHAGFQEGEKKAMSRMFDRWKKLGRNPYFKKMVDGTERHVAEIIGDASIDFLETQPKEQPFFLYMSFNISHAEDGDKRPGIGHFPWPKREDGLYEDIVPREPTLDREKYFAVLPQFLQQSLNRERYFWRWDTPGKYRTNMRAYYRMLTGMDRIVGRVLTRLTEMGAADDTIVIYSADNGYYMGDRGLAGKWSHFDQSLRVPLIVYDPRLPVDRRGRVVAEMAMGIDISATILEAAGVAVPKKYQGRPLQPLLIGAVPPDWRTDVYCEHHMRHPAIPKWYGVRGARYTYANYYEEGVELLYDLEKDPTQFNDLAGNAEYAGVLKRMRTRSEEFVKQYTRPEIEQLKREFEAKLKSKKQ